MDESLAATEDLLEVTYDNCLLRQHTMLLGIVKRRPNEDALLPLEAEAADVCVRDPGHGSGKDTGAGALPQMKMRNRCHQRNGQTRN
jgi:hypothetical protein